MQISRVYGQIARLAIALFLGTSVAVADGPGLVETPPDGVRSVQTDLGYMIPYDQLIPGTELTVRMIPVPGGEYQMGSPEAEAGRNSLEGPQRLVRVQPFWMAETETTWLQYKAYMNLYHIFKEFQENGIRQVTDDNRVDAITAPTPLYEPDFTFEFGEDDEQPAVTVTQYSAKQFTKWISRTSGLQFRLPTEAEWEYACRAGTTTAYSFGDDPELLGEYAWYAGNTEDGGARHVRQKKPNPWGLYDMHGNAAEWTLDAYGDYPESDGVFDGTQWARTDSPYPRTVRGGSWEFPAEQLRSAARLGSHDPDWKEYDPNLPKSPWWFTSDPARGVGFRMIRPLKAVADEKMADAWEIDAEDIEYDVNDRLDEGRGAIGLVNPSLPAATEALGN